MSTLPVPNLWDDMYTHTDRKLHKNKHQKLLFIKEITCKYETLSLNADSISITWLFCTGCTCMTSRTVQ